MVDSGLDRQDRIASDSDGRMIYYLNCKMGLMFTVPSLNITPPAGEMRGEAAPYSLVPSAESSLLQEREGEAGADMDIKADNNNVTTKVVTSNSTNNNNNNNNKEKKRG